jgi:hypothetical protein
MLVEREKNEKGKRQSGRKTRVEIVNKRERNNGRDGFNRKRKKNKE